jgi:hypothetical protein
VRREKRTRKSVLFSPVNHRVSSGAASSLWRFPHERTPAASSLEVISKRCEGLKDRAEFGSTGTKLDVAPSSLPLRQL